MKNMKVKMKLLVSFIAVAILSAAVGAVGVFCITMLNERDTQMFDFVSVTGKVGDMREAYQKVRSDFRELVAVCQFEDPSSMNTVLSNIRTDIANLQAAFDAYQSDAYADASKEADFYTCKTVFEQEYAPIIENAQKVAQETRSSAETYKIMKTGTEVASRIETALEATVADNISWADELNKANDGTASLASIVQIVFLALAVCAAMFFAFYISGLISKPLIVLTEFMQKAGTTGDIQTTQEEKEKIDKFSQAKDEIGQTLVATAAFVNHVRDIGKNLETIAGGDLTAPVRMLSDDDTMGHSLRTMLNNLNNMFSEINAATGQVSAGSKQIADGAQALAAGSTQQASSVEELAASLSEVSTKTNENAAMAKEASGLSNEIKGNAEKGSIQMEQMMTAVTEINEASGSISKVIKVIDDIAFQTNILALNAAVEAARAGQHGKGFAVVAEEVRNLAAKSAEAAKDTSSLIENSIEKANFGLTIATETSASLQGIVEGINRNAEIIIKIEDSSEEQSKAITQINVGIDQVAQVVQQNSATAEESAAASEEMSGQANMLEQLISQFKLKEESGLIGSSKPSTSASAKPQTRSANPNPNPKPIHKAPVHTAPPTEFDFNSFDSNDKY